MNIKEKISIFEESCKKLLSKDVTNLSRSIDKDVENQIKDELEEYEKIEKFMYQKKIEKLEKEYNKQIYMLEMNCKKEISNEKKNIQKDLKKEVTNLLKEFTKTPEYKDFLMDKIDEVIAKNDNVTTSIISIVKADKENYGDEIKKKYGVQIQEIEDKYIGGCILEDNIQGIYIDNTIQNSINEKIGC